MSWAASDKEFRARVTAYNREQGSSSLKPNTESKLPANWENMSLDALWNALNDPRRFENQKNAGSNGGPAKGSNDDEGSSPIKGSAQDRTR